VTRQTGNLADLGDVEDLENLRIAEEGFRAVSARAKPDIAFFDVVHQIVDDVCSSGSRCHRARPRHGAWPLARDIEAEDHRAGRGSELHIRFADAADAHKCMTRAPISSLPIFSRAWTIASARAPAHPP
jgi:hypothetical protein